MSGSGDSAIKIWNLNSGNLIDSIYTSNNGFIQSLKFSKRTGHIIVGLHNERDYRGWTEVWDLKRRKLENVIEPDFEASRAFTPTSDYKYLIGVSNYGSDLVILDFKSGHPVNVLKNLIEPPKYEGGEKDFISDFVVSHDCKYIFISTYSNLLKKIDILSGEILNSVQIRGLRNLKILPPGKLLAEVRSELQIRDINSLEIINRIENPHKKGMNYLIFTPDIKYLISAGTQIIVTELSSGNVVNQFGKGSFMSDTELVRDDKVISIVDDILLYWDINDGNVIKKVPTKPKTIEPHTSTNGKYFSTYVDTSSFSGADIWEIDKLECIHNIKDYYIMDFNDKGTLCACNPSISLSSYSWSKQQKKGLISILEIPSGKIKFSVKVHDDSIKDIKFSPKKKLIASTSYDKTIKIWDYQTGKIIHNIKDYRDVRKLFFSPDGKYLVGGDRNGNFTFWEISNGKEFKQISGRGDNAKYLCFSHDGKFIAFSRSKNSVIVKNFKEDISYGPFNHFSGIYKIAFSKNDEFLITITHNGNLYLWDFLHLLN